MKKAELIVDAQQFLIEQYAAGRKVLLIIDEAQNLSNKVLEEIRMLSGIETTKEKVLRIILAGQPELNEKLDSPELIQLAQRIRLRFHLTPLSKTDTRPTSSIAWKSPARTAGRSSIPRRYPADLPLHRRHSAPGQHAVRHRDDGRVRAGPRRRQVDDMQGGDRGTAVGRVRGALSDMLQALGPGHHDPPAMRPASGASCSGASWSRFDGKTMRGARADAGPLHHRPHAGQRSADRQQISSAVITARS